MQKYHLIPILAMLLSCLSCADKSQDGKPLLLVSIEPQKKLLDELVGDNFSTIAILSNGANPETFDPTMNMRMQASNAVAFFSTGHLPYEQVITKSVNDNAKVIDTSQGIDPLLGTHGNCSAHHDHGDADPHVWSSVRNAQLMALNMLNGLIDIDPDNADEYRKRYAALESRLDSLDNAFARKLTQANVHAFAIWHPSLSYFAKDYGLHQISIGQESKEATVANLHGAISKAKEDSVKVFFFQKEFDSRQAQSISDEIGARLVEMSPMSYDWETELSNIVDELTKQ